MTPKPTCDYCGEVIGVYEPIVVIVDGEVQETSRAAEQVVTAVRALRYHRDCYAQRSAQSPPALR